MNISIKTTNMELTPALRDYTEKRLGNITKYTGGDASINAEIGKSTEHHKQGEVFFAEVNAITPLGKQHYARAEKTDLYEAIDVVRNEIIAGLSRDKGKRQTLFKRGAQRIKNIIRGFRS